MTQFPLPLHLVLIASLCCCVGGCGTGPTPPTGTTADHSSAPGAESSDAHEHETPHSHPTQGPHDGHLIELGNEEYHAELLHDEATGTVSIYLLDESGTQEVPIAERELALQLFREGQFVEYRLAAVAEQAEGCSLFELVDADLCEALDHEAEVQGRLQVTIAGVPYTGTIVHAAHEGHDDHAHEAEPEEDEDHLHEAGHEGHDH